MEQGAPQDARRDHDVHGPSGELLSRSNFKDDGSEEDSYHGYNPHSDVEQITDDKGNSRATYGYTAYGKNDQQQFTGVDKPQDPGNPDDPNQEPYNAYRFNAKRWDQRSGDYDMGFRDYLQEALRAVRRCHDRFGEIRVLAGFDAVYRASGRRTQADEHRQNALALAEKIGSSYWQTKLPGMLEQPVYRDMSVRGS